MESGKKNKPWGCKGPNQRSRCCHLTSEQRDWPDAAKMDDNMLHWKDRNTNYYTSGHFFLQIKLRTTSQLGRFCTETHKLINSSNHSLQKKNKWLQKQKLTVLNTSTWHLIDNNVKGSAVCSRSRLLKLQFITYNYVCMYIYLATWNWIV